MKRMLVVAVLLLAPLGVRAQMCDTVVADDAGVLSANQIRDIYNASLPLMNQGADVRVRTTLGVANLDIAEQIYEHGCPSWQGGNGGRKSTLIALLVSPAGKKVGIYYGAAWHGALDAHWNRIKQDYMVPHFRDHDWAGGFIAAETQLAARLVASKDEALHPAVTQVTHQATNYAGLWIVLGILALFLVAWGIYAVIRRVLDAQDEAEGAQQEAIIRRNAATDRINRYKEEVTAATQGAYDLAVENFYRLMSSEATNPDTNGLTAEQYENIGEEYWDVCRQLDRAIRPTTEQAATPITPDSHPKHPKYRHATAGASEAASTVAVQSPSTSIFAPVIINEETYETHHHDVDESPAPEPSTYEAPSHSSDDNSGGSSSWGSSDSSSSFDGGSSSFDSGSSFGDSGGGGSSDF